MYGNSGVGKSNLVSEIIRNLDKEIFIEKFLNFSA